MEPQGRSGFEKGESYTRRQIHEVLGGSTRAALPTRGGKVVCACLTREKNPRAPDAMVVTGAARAVRLARVFADSGAAVPVFIRGQRGGWEYAGDRRVRAVVDEAGALAALIAEGAPSDTALALLLEMPSEGVPTTTGDASRTAPPPAAAPGA
jgi:hypothetical protein